MPITAVFTPPSLTVAQYDACIQQLEQAGAAAPAGRLYHLFHLVDGRPQVIDVWDSMESFQQFGQTLMPIAARLGFDPGQPVISEVRNIIKG